MQQLVHNGIYRGPRPKSLKEVMRYDVVISLQSGVFNVFNNDEYRRILWPDTGIKFYNLEQNDFTPPSLEDVTEFIQILKANEGKSIYVHCKAGVDRTGYMIAAYRMICQGWSHEKAWQEMKDQGSHVWYRWWGKSLKQYEGDL